MFTMPMIYTLQDPLPTYISQRLFFFSPSHQINEIEEGCVHGESVLCTICELFMNTFSVKLK